MRAPSFASAVSVEADTDAASVKSPVRKVIPGKSDAKTRRLPSVIRDGRLSDTCQPVTGFSGVSASGTLNNNLSTAPCGLIT